MSRTSSAIREFLSPGSIRRASIPPLEAGLRPNSRLDDSPVLFGDADGSGASGVSRGDITSEPDDVAPWQGVLAISSGNTLTLQGPVNNALHYEGPITALRSVGDRLLIAVEGVGIVGIDASGKPLTICEHHAVKRCVTDLAPIGDTLVVAIGSNVASANAWAHELVARRATGQIVAVRGESVEVIASGLEWPSGIAPAGGDDYLVSVSMAHRIERRSLTSSTVTPVIANSAGYPGRIRERDLSRGGGWWIAVPYLRNRATELILGDDPIRNDMATNVEADLWLVPQLRSENVYRDPLQIGQQRVMGVIKPWAPPRSYGLAFRLDIEGRVIESVHSRPDGARKGVTAATPTADGVLVVCRGARVVVRIQEESA
jgi:hypothetical protein